MKLTIGMASYKNLDQVWFTVQSLRMHHDLTDVEILVVDNYGDDSLADFINHWCGENVRYIRYTDIQGTAAPRQKVFEEARGEWVMCIDSHVLLPLGVVQRVKGWIDAHPERQDLIHGPMLYYDLRNMADAMHPTWGGGMWGQWRGAHCQDEGDAYEIPMHGMGLFLCRKDAWLGFNPQFRGFGGEEGYIHEKYRQAGHKSICLTWLKWCHKFATPGSVPYTPLVEDMRHNYEIGFSELGLDKSEFYRQYGITDRIMPPYGRKESFDRVIEIIKGRKNWNILEIGSTRTKGNWEGDGYSTPLFAWLAGETGSRFTSVDVHPQDVCLNILSDYNLTGNATLTQMDAHEYVNRVDTPIDFLYLDGWDWSADSGTSEEEHLRFVKAIESMFSKDAYCLIDDIHNTETFEGKGKLVIPYLINKGWEIVYRGYQTLLHRCAGSSQADKVSCVMITYRRQTCVERSISLFLAQTYGNAELIIYNTDTDHPVTLGGSLAGAPITVINNNLDYSTREPYGDVGAIRRDALSHATGRYYICWDDDDIFLHYNIAQCVAGIQRSGTWAWKPARSMWRAANGVIEIASNAMEASIISLADRVREMGYTGHQGGGEHHQWLNKFSEAGQLFVDETAIPAYSFNWCDDESVRGHKQSGTIDDPENFTRHKAGCTDIHTRPMERVDVQPTIEMYLSFLRANGHLSLP